MKDRKVIHITSAALSLIHLREEWKKWRHSLKQRRKSETFTLSEIDLIE